MNLVRALKELTIALEKGEINNKLRSLSRWRWIRRQKLKARLRSLERMRLIITGKPW